MEIAGLGAQTEIPCALLNPEVTGLGNIYGWNMKPFELCQNPWNCRLSEAQADLNPEHSLIN